MNVKLAEESGFCFGVKKALERIKNIENKKDVYVLGRLIHNPQVIDKLKKSGIMFVENLDEINKGTLVISAHGVSDDVIEKAKEKGLNIIDTTCPLVKNIHNITKRLEKEGYRIIIFGDREHTEVKGIQGNLRNVIVISDVNELDNLTDEKSALVSQTTQDVVKFNGVGDILKGQIKDLVIEDTICFATRLRQENTKKLAKEVDMIVVIGGKISANTRQLARICLDFVETHHIESEKELRKEWFEGKHSIGITAGASTPENVINKVIDRIKNGF